MRPNIIKALILSLYALYLIGVPSCILLSGDEQPTEDSVEVVPYYRCGSCGNDEVYFIVNPNTDELMIDTLYCPKCKDFRPIEMYNDSVSINKW